MAKALSTAMNRGPLMTRFSWLSSCLGVLFLAACGAPEAPAEESPASEYGMVQNELGALQGAQLQGAQLQGAQLQGTELQGVQFQGITQNGVTLAGAKVEKGGLVAKKQVPLSGHTQSLNACAVQSSGAGRSCGFLSMGVGSCTPGQAVAVGGGGCGLGASQGDTVMRVCSGTAPCEANSRSLLDSDEGACFSTSPRVSFTCPSSGFYNVLAGPQVTGNGWRMSVEESAGELPAYEVLSGTELQGAQLTGATQGAQSVQLRIAQVVNGASPVNGVIWDSSGFTYLYQVEYYEPGAASWMPLCSSTMTGSNWAVPIKGIFDSTGALDTSNPNLFTFGCENGVIAKCYRWGYKPWPENPAKMTDAHWACTRMARADYCGDGQTHTQNGTLINLWDKLSPQVQSHGSPPPDLLFEAGWNTQGAVCLSHDRWAHLTPNLCPGKLYAPEYVVPGGTGAQCSPGQHSTDPGAPCASVCDTDYGALVFDPSVLLFNESRLNGVP
jgi:uncharacterized protein YjbI with pentapeptide repeats